MGKGFSHQMFKTEELEYYEKVRKDLGFDTRTEMFREAVKSLVETASTMKDDTDEGKDIED